MSEERPNAAQGAMASSLSPPRHKMAILCMDLGLVYHVCPHFVCSTLWHQSTVHFKLLALSVPRMCCTHTGGSSRQGSDSRRGQGAPGQARQAARTALLSRDEGKAVEAYQEQGVPPQVSKGELLCSIALRAVIVPCVTDSCRQRDPPPLCFCVPVKQSHLECTEV